MVLVQLEATDDLLTTDVKQWNDERTLASLYYLRSVAYALLLGLLLARIDLGQTLLNILEVEGNSIGLGEQLMNDVLLQRYQVLLRLLPHLLIHKSIHGLLYSLSEEVVR